MKVYGLLESASVKIQTLKTAIEVSSNHDQKELSLTSVRYAAVTSRRCCFRPKTG